MTLVANDRLPPAPTQGGAPGRLAAEFPGTRLRINSAPCACNPVAVATALRGRGRVEGVSLWSGRVGSGA